MLNSDYFFVGPKSTRKLTAPAFIIDKSSHSQPKQPTKCNLFELTHLKILPIPIRTSIIKWSFSFRLIQMSTPHLFLNRPSIHHNHQPDRLSAINQARLWMIWIQSLRMSLLGILWITIIPTKENSVNDKSVFLMIGLKYSR